MWPSLRTNLSKQMTPRDLRNIHTTGNSCRDALACANMALKLPQQLPADRKAFGRYFQVRSPYYQVEQSNQKTPIPLSWRWQVRSEKAERGEESTLITTTTSVHSPKPVSTNLTIKPDSVLTNTIGKNLVQSWWNIYPIRHFYCDTITRSVPKEG